jgi:hypothetical protein
MTYDYSTIPEHLREGFNNWLCHGIEPGSFLRAVLTNDLVGAVVRADEVSLANLRPIVQFLLDQAPEGSFGSPRVLRDWPDYLRALERQADQAAAEGAY